MDMSKADRIKWIMTIVATLAIVLIPANGLYTESMKTFMVLTVFALLVIAFEFLPSAVMVILLPVLYIVFGVAPASVVMAPWVGELMLLILGAFAFSAVLMDSGLLRRVAYYLMSKVNGSYTKLLVGIFIIGVVLSFLTFGNGHLILAPLCAGLCLAFNIMKTRMGAGIAMACMIGTCTAHTFTYPISTYAVVAGSAGGLADETFASMNLLSVVAHNFPMFFVMLLVIVLIAKWYKPEKELDSAAYCKEKLEQMGKMSGKEKRVTVILVCVIGYTVLSSFIGMSVNWGFMLVPWLAFFPIIKCADRDTITKYMNWDMVFFMAGCMSIGTVAATLGFSGILSSVMGSIFASGGTLSTFGAVFGIVFVMNFLMTPMAIWALLTAPLMQVAIDLGMSQLPFMYCLVGCAEAIILPYEYAPYLIVYAFGMITMKDFVKLNILRCVVFVCGFLFVLVPYWMLIGLI